MKLKLLGFVLLAAGSMFGAWNVGIRIGPPPAPRVVVRTASPGPGYTYVEGYSYPVNGRYQWHAGYWTRPPYEGAAWVTPRYEGQQYYNGYWQGTGHEPMEHNHASDRNRKNRDYQPKRR